jgi:hypothetical protein
MASKNLFAPRYADTTAANADKGIDSCGALIFTYDVNNYWLRKCSPKRWEQVGTGSGSTSITNIYNNSITGATIDGNCIYINLGSGTNLDTVCSITLTTINYFQFLSDTSIEVCGFIYPDTLTNVCDTLYFSNPNGNTLYLFDNGLRQTDGHVEFGDNEGVYHGDAVLKHNTFLDVYYQKLIIPQATVYEYGVQFRKYPSFGFQNGIGLTSWLHENTSSQPNVVRLGIGYNGGAYETSPSYIKGYWGDSLKGYYIGTNVTNQGSNGLLLDNANAKTGSIFFHTTDTDNDDGITFFTAAQATSTAGYYPLSSNGFGNYKRLSIKTNGDLQFHNYDSSTRNDGLVLNGKILTTDTSGNVVVGKLPLTTSVLSEGSTALYKMSNANLTNGYENITTAGAMATAVVTQVGDYDNIVVGGSDQASYFFPADRIFTATPIMGHIRVKAVSLGGTAPILGFRIISAPAPYVNFTNQQGYIYVNLSSGAMTSSFSGYATTTTTNNLSGSVSANEIVDVYFEWEYNNQMKMILVRNNLNGETSQITKTWSAQVNSSASICRLAVIMADGTYQLLSYEIGVKSFQRPKVLIAGDSELSGACIAYNETVFYQLKTSIPYNIAQFSAPASYLAGMQAVQRDILQINPEVVFFDNILDALFNNDCDPGDPQYATWSANFNKYVNAFIQAGIEPILFVPSCTPLYPDSRVTTMISYWTTNFPGRKYVNRLSTDGGFDCTGFHFNAAANAIIVTKLITELNALEVL